MLEAREILITNIQTNLTNEEKELLLSFKCKEPQWVKLGISGIEKLPAIQWKIQNLNKMDPGKHRVALENLQRVVKAIREQFSKFIEAVDSDENTDDELVDITSTNWYKKISSEMKPKDYLKTYRKVHNFTQSQLSEKIGVSVQYLSDMENGKRAISRQKAKVLAGIFGCNHVKRLI